MNRLQRKDKPYQEIFTDLRKVSEEDEIVIQFYSHPSKKYWEFPLDEALKVLEKAKQKMIALGPKSPTPIDERFKT